MPDAQHIYLAIDLKSFFASVECVERGLDPLSTNLVVADASRTEKTICLAVSPSLKAYGIAGRARLFEVVQRVREVNRERARHAPGGRLVGKSHFDAELKARPELAVDYVVAPPHMSRYVSYSARIYGVYLRYIAPEDIYAYSIDEVFIDATPYLDTYKLTPHQLAVKLIREVLAETGITATAGIGTNLYLAKVAMDVVAKHVEADADGVRIAELDEMSYRRKLWNYQPITKFWRIGKGIARKLATHGMYTMGDVARQSLRNDELLYKLFGVNAELLIDHAWGWEPCTMAYIKAYRPTSKSLSRGQVLHQAYNVTQARVVMREMVDEMALTLLDKQLLTNQLVIDVGYDRESINLPDFWQVYHGDIVADHYGRSVPRPARATANLADNTSSAHLMAEAVMRAFDEVVNPHLLVRRMNLTANHVVTEQYASNKARSRVVQLDLFTDYEQLERERAAERERLERERRVQQTMLNIKKTFGKNAILKGLNFADGATTIERNSQIGGHKA